MFRRQIEARDEWNARTPAGCADRQLEILAQAARMLAPGGAMVYSTCTFNDVENEGVLARFLDAHPEFALRPFALPGLPPADKGFVHLYPHEIRGEGHFVSLLCRRAAGENSTPERSSPGAHVAPGDTPRRQFGRAPRETEAWNDYALDGIPACFLIDARDGRIVAKNLRGEALAGKVAQLLME